MNPSTNLLESIQNNHDEDESFIEQFKSPLYLKIILLVLLHSGILDYLNCEFIIG